jgi:hypothetical protein
MPINPNIALSLQPVDIAGSIQRGMDWHDQRQDKKRLADLLPQAAGGDQAAIDDLWAIDPRIAEHMDDRQRAEAAAKTEDLTAAVRWADTPEKWSYVQQHYGSEGVDLSPYRFEDRERGLLELGKLSGYLKGNEGPNATSDMREYDLARSQGFTGSFMDFKNQMGSPIMVDNGDGTKTLYPRAMLSGGQQSQVPPPPPGFQIDGGPTAPQSGGFRGPF